MSARPYSKLWHSDWIADLRFRSCTLAERGAFFGLYCLMHQGAGRLPCTLEVAAQSLAADPDELARAVKSLVRAGLLTWDGDTLTDPELQRVLALSAERAKHGSEGGKVSTDGRKNGVFAQAKNASKMRGSGSGSISPSGDGEEGAGRRGPLEVETTLEDERFGSLRSDPEYVALVREWVQYRQELHKPLTPTGLRNLHLEALRFGRDRFIAGTRHAMASGWQGTNIDAASQPNGNGHHNGHDIGGKTAAKIAFILQQGKELAARHAAKEIQP